MTIEAESLTMRHVYNQETVVLRAAINRDKEMAFRAFVNDPLVTIGIEDARTLFEAMLSNIKEYLPGWNFQ